MVCKDEVYTWFKNLSGPKRIDFVCGLLHMCLPLELRFFGSVVEDLAKKDYHYLRQAEIKSNDAIDLKHLTRVTDEIVRHRLSVALALVHSTNSDCSNTLFNILTYLTSCVSMIPLNDHSAKELLLMYIMATNHPAFTFDQRQRLFEQQMSIENHCKDFLQTEGCDRCQGGLVTTGTETDGSIIHKPVCVEEIAVECCRFINNHYEFNIQVSWDNGDISEVCKTYQDLHEFHTKLLKLFPEEAGAHRQKRKIPYFQSLHSKQRALKEESLDHIKSLVVEYTQQLAALPSYIMECDHVVTFFNGMTDDQTTSSSSAKSSPVNNQSNAMNHAKSLRNSQSEPVYTPEPPEDGSIISPTGQVKTCTIYNSQIGDSPIKPVTPPIGKMVDPVQQSAPINNVNTLVTNHRHTYTFVASSPSPHGSPLPSPLSSPHISPSLCSPMVLTSGGSSPVLPPGNSPQSSPRPGNAIQQWLKKIRLHKYADRLSTYTFEELLRLSDKDFQNQGLTEGAIGKLRREINCIKENKNVNGISMLDPNGHVVFKRSPQNASRQLMSPPVYNIAQGYLQPSGLLAPVQKLFPQQMEPSVASSIDSSSLCSEYSSPAASPVPEHVKSGDSQDELIDSDSQLQSPTNRGREDLHTLLNNSLDQLEAYSSSQTNNPCVDMVDGSAPLTSQFLNNAPSQYVPTQNSVSVLIPSDRTISTSYQSLVTIATAPSSVLAPGEQTIVNMPSGGQIRNILPPGEHMPPGGQIRTMMLPSSEQSVSVVPQSGQIRNMVPSCEHTSMPPGGNIRAMRPQMIGHVNPHVPIQILPHPMIWQQQQQVRMPRPAIKPAGHQTNAPTNYMTSKVPLNGTPNPVSQSGSSVASGNPNSVNTNTVSDVVADISKPPMNSVSVSASPLVCAGVQSPDIIATRSGSSSYVTTVPSIPGYPVQQQVPPAPVADELNDKNKLNISTDGQPPIYKSVVTFTPIQKSANPMINSIENVQFRDSELVPPTQCHPRAESPARQEPPQMITVSQAACDKPLGVIPSTSCPPPGNIVPQEIMSPPSGPPPGVIPPQGCPPPGVMLLPQGVIPPSGPPPVGVSSPSTVSTDSDTAQCVDNIDNTTKKLDEGESVSVSKNVQNFESFPQHLPHSSAVVPHSGWNHPVVPPGVQMLPPPMIPGTDHRNMTATPPGGQSGHHGSQPSCSNCGCNGQHNAANYAPYNVTFIRQPLPYMAHPNFIPPTSNGLVNHLAGLPFSPMHHGHLPNGLSQDLMYNQHSHNVNVLPSRPPGTPPGHFRLPHMPYHSIAQKPHGKHRLSCYNCGVAGHRASECTQKTMDSVTSQGHYHLNYQPKSDSD
ncbi:unnamed protein product [Owenia fusiformis]|uniref:Uncharacterized protein n=1 Tax=Owenia fusiformis TaxID=6347 RepID=A0A8J1UTS1_OWEFU|nr:unnamed protein product [Owenia fusiformis]